MSLKKLPDDTGPDIPEAHQMRPDVSVCSQGSKHCAAEISQPSSLPELLAHRIYISVILLKLGELLEHFLNK